MNENIFSIFDFILYNIHKKCLGYAILGYYLSKRL